MDRNAQQPSGNKRLNEKYLLDDDSSLSSLPDLNECTENDLVQYAMRRCKLKNRNGKLFSRNVDAEQHKNIEKKPAFNIQLKKRSIRNEPVATDGADKPVENPTVLQAPRLSSLRSVAKPVITVNRDIGLSSAKKKINFIDEPPSSLFQTPNQDNANLMINFTTTFQFDKPQAMSTPFHTPSKLKPFKLIQPTSTNENVPTTTTTTATNENAASNEDIIINNNSENPINKTFITPTTHRSINAESLPPKQLSKSHVNISNKKPQENRDSSSDLMTDDETPEQTNAAKDQQTNKSDDKISSNSHKTRSREIRTENSSNSLKLRDISELLIPKLVKSHHDLCNKSNQTANSAKAVTILSNELIENSQNRNIVVSEANKETPTGTCDSATQTDDDEIMTDDDDIAIQLRQLESKRSNPLVKSPASTLSGIDPINAPLPVLPSAFKVPHPSGPQRKSKKIAQTEIPINQKSVNSCSTRASKSCYDNIVIMDATDDIVENSPQTVAKHISSFKTVVMEKPGSPIEKRVRLSQTNRKKRKPSVHDNGKLESYMEIGESLRGKKKKSMADASKKRPLFSRENELTAERTPNSKKLDAKLKVPLKDISQHNIDKHSKGFKSLSNIINTFNTRRTSNKTTANVQNNNLNDSDDEMEGSVRRSQSKVSRKIKNKRAQNSSQYEDEDDTEHAARESSPLAEPINRSSKKITNKRKQNSRHDDDDDEVDANRESSTLAQSINLTTSKTGKKMTNKQKQNSHVDVNNKTSLIVEINNHPTSKNGIKTRQMSKNTHDNEIVTKSSIVNNQSRKPKPIDRPTLTNANKSNKQINKNAIDNSTEDDDDDNNDNAVRTNKTKTVHNLVEDLYRSRNSMSSQSINPAATSVTANATNVRKKRRKRKEVIQLFNYDPIKERDTEGLGDNVRRSKRDRKLPIQYWKNNPQPIMPLLLCLDKKGKVSKPRNNTKKMENTQSSQPPTEETDESPKIVSSTTDEIIPDSLNENITNSNINQSQRKTNLSDSKIFKKPAVINKTIRKRRSHKRKDQSELRSSFNVVDDTGTVERVEENTNNTITSTTTPTHRRTLTNQTTPINSSTVNDVNNLSPSSNISSEFNQGDSNGSFLQLLSGKSSKITKKLPAQFINKRAEIVFGEDIEFTDIDGVEYGYYNASIREFGYMKFKPLSKKKKTRTMQNLSCIVLKGELEITINDIQSTINMGSLIKIPSGSYYELFNGTNRWGIILFQKN